MSQAPFPTPHGITVKIKKCAAEATHEKRIAPIAATQVYTKHKYVKTEHAFLPEGKKIHTYAL